MTVIPTQRFESTSRLFDLHGLFRHPPLTNPSKRMRIHLTQKKENYYPIISETNHVAENIVNAA